jgi:hypothetical protein
MPKSPWAEWALDDDQLHPFAGHFDCVGMAQLVRSEAAPHAGRLCDPLELRAWADVRARPRLHGVRAVDASAVEQAALPLGGDDHAGGAAGFGRRRAARAARRDRAAARGEIGERPGVTAREPAAASRVSGGTLQRCCDDSTPSGRIATISRTADAAPFSTGAQPTRQPRSTRTARIAYAARRAAIPAPLSRFRVRARHEPDEKPASPAARAAAGRSFASAQAA